MSELLVLLFVLSPVLVAYLIYRNYQLEKKWRCLRYCWTIMSDFACETLRDDEGELDERWKAVVDEHLAFMRRFRIPLLGDRGLKLYEAALIDREILPLREHW